MLLAGDRIVTIDNVERPVGGDLLCQVVTEPLVNIRLLGTLSRLIAPNVTSWFFTGNNLTFTGDMIRRVGLIRLDANCERPELREFKTSDPVVAAARERPRLVAAALTILRAFTAAGWPRSHPPIGSFADWSRFVRDPLIWLGRPDPADAMTAARRDDPRLGALRAILEQWALVICDERITARQLVALAAPYADFRAALLTVAAERGEISARRLGRWLGQVRGRRVDGKRIEAAETLHGIARWRLASEEGGEGV